MPTLQFTAGMGSGFLSASYVICKNLKFFEVLGYFGLLLKQLVSLKPRSHTMKALQLLQEKRPLTLL